jgi:hypothetical protein
MKKGAKPKIISSACNVVAGTATGGGGRSGHARATSVHAHHSEISTIWPTPTRKKSMRKRWRAVERRGRRGWQAFGPGDSGFGTLA